MFQLINARLMAKALAIALSVLSFAAHADTKTRVSSFEYGTTGLLTREVIEPDRPDDCLQTSYSYDVYGNKTTVSTAACAGATGYSVYSAATARTASVGFATDGRFPTSTTNALSHSEVKLFDARFGTVTKLQGPNLLTTYWSYDSFGRKSRETRADTTYTTWTYLLCSEVGANCPGPIAGATISWVAIEQSYAANNSPSAPEKRQFHDSLGRVARVQTQGFDGSGAAPTLVQDTEHNALGQVARKSNLYALNGGTAYWSSYYYDVLGRLQREETPDPDAAGGVAITTIAYNGLSSTTTNSKSQTKTTTKNAQGNVVQVTDAQNNTIGYAYDALGNLLATNAAGSVTRMSYNQRGQKVTMIDPAMGSWEYRYNAFGELVSQRNSLSQVTTMAYDVLGRMTQRSEPDLVSQWSYDKNFDNTACGKGVGKLCEAKADSGYNRKHSYDALGRTGSTATVLDNAAAPATVSASYDPNTGRVSTKTWPTGYQARYAYSALGYLKTVTGGGSNGFTETVTYEVQAVNAQGQITQYRYGNQITTVKTYNDANNRLSGQIATKVGQASGNVLNQSYKYDSLGNLTSRTDNTPGVGTQEGFSYDTLNRLALASMVGGGVSPPQTTEVLYDTRGNITYKSDVGRYAYDAARPGRVTTVTLETAPGATVALSGTRALSYVFDDSRSGVQSVDGVPVGNGNLQYTVSHDTAHNRHTVRSESYTSFNMPNQISYGNFITNTSSTADRTLSFVYGPEHQRIKQNVSLSGNGTSSYFAGNTWYLDGQDGLDLSYEKEIRSNGTTENKHYVRAGGVVFALFTSRTGLLNGLPTTSPRYFNHDHLGSIAAITNETGAVVERLAFDPWGKRRNINGVADVLDSIVGSNTDRGYTLHEHLDEVGVIHMNGRIYDPLVGRFMSADPFIQNASDLQSYNRYAYVMNNPLMYTDPSGYFSWKKLLRTAVSIYVGYLTGGLMSGYLEMGGLLGGSGGTIFASANAVLTPLGSAVAGAAGGFASGAIGSGTMNGALHGALSGGLFGAAGAVPDAASAGRYAAHAAAGCISSIAGGSKCGSGAASALFGKFATNATPQGWDPVARGIAATVAGGVGSVIGGGKFESGAVTAAYGYLFNHLSSVGVNFRVPFIGGAKFAAGVSYENGEWDAGLIIESDVPAVHVGKMLGKATLDISYQKGDFKSNAGDLNMNFEAGAAGIGGSVQRGPNGITGGGLSVGPQLGGSIGGQQTRTMSYRTHVAPVIDKLQQWFK